MKSRGIIFSAPMVRAMLDNRKFVTRRLNKSWLKYKKGDEIWVRETWAECFNWCVTTPSKSRTADMVMTDPPYGTTIMYRADGREEYNFSGGNQICLLAVKWRPSIFMPRWASRISHILTEDAREERLQDITKEEAKMEGCTNGSPLYALSLYDFRDLWNTLHPKKDRWEDNPVVVRLCWL